MSVAEVRELVANCLPLQCAHLKLTFYGSECRPMEGCVVVGDDFGTELCVGLADGAVYSRDPQGKIPNRFVNSGIRQFAQFIEVVEAFSDRPLVDSKEVAVQMRSAMQSIDPAALSGPENWWALVLEQLACGL